MKKNVFIICGILLLSYACMKENEQSGIVNKIEQVDVSVQNKMLDDMAYAVALSLNNKEIRSAIKTDLEKMFDFDYDVLYSLVKDHTFNENGKIKSLSQIINYNLKARGKNLTDEKISSLVNNLQLSMPMNFDSWDAENYVPEVVVVPVNDKDDQLYLNGYDSKGNAVSINVKEPVSKPLLIVRKSERVDESGKLLVDKNGILLPEKYRVSASKAFRDAPNLKSAKIKSTDDNLINIIADNEFHTLKIENDNNTDFSGNSLYMADQTAINVDVTKNIVNRLKSVDMATAIPPAPLYLRAEYGTVAGSVVLKWDESAEATSYDIYMATNDGNLTLFTSSTLPYISISNLAVNVKHTFGVKAVNSLGSSPLSNTYYIIPSQRAKGEAECIRKIYISNSRYAQVEPAYNGRIELKFEIILSYKDNEGKDMTSLTNSTTRGDGNSEDGPTGIAKAEISDQWYYTSIDLASPGWDPDLHSFVLNVIITEMDGRQAVPISKNITTAGEVGFGTTLAGLKPTTNINGKYSETCVTNYTYQNQEQILINQPVYYTDPINKLYPFDEFKFVTGHVFNNNKCPYMGSYDASNNWCYIAQGMTKTQYQSLTGKSIQAVLPFVARKGIPFVSDFGNIKKTTTLDEDCFGYVFWSMSPAYGICGPGHILKEKVKLSIVHLTVCKEMSITQPVDVRYQSAQNIFHASPGN